MIFIPKMPGCAFQRDVLCEVVINIFQQFIGYAAVPVPIINFCVFHALRADDIEPCDFIEKRNNCAVEHVLPQKQICGIIKSEFRKTLISVGFGKRRYIIGGKDSHPYF